MEQENLSKKTKKAQHAKETLTKELIKTLKGFFCMRQVKKTFKKFFYLPSILNSKELFWTRISIILIFLGTFGLLINYHFSTGIELPTDGGVYREAILGYPQYLNPVLSYGGNADRDIVKLVYSGLMKYDSEGNIIPDLAEDFSIEDNGKIYTFYLRKNVLWHDKETFDADDVIFTIETIQDAEYNSPIRFNWEGVEIEKIDEWTIAFKLKTAYAPFLTNTTVGIVPEHIWQNFSPEDFWLSKRNLEPIGTGAFKLGQVEKDSNKLIDSIVLEKNNDYYLKNSYLEKLIFKFYSVENNILNDFNNQKIDGITLSSSYYQDSVKNIERNNFFYPLLPRYFAIFFNPDNNPSLSNKNFRIALSYATNKKEIIESVFGGEALKIDSPILPYLISENSESEESAFYEYDLAKAEEFLEKSSQEAPFVELSVPDMPELSETAKILQENWQKLGVEVKISLIPPSEVIDNNIRTRNYEAILFGQVLVLDLDPFSFWHSSQKQDPGLNLSSYENSSVDLLLKSGRQELDLEKRMEIYNKVSSQIAEDAAAIFLYSPRYVYIVNNKIKGINILKMNLPSDRFSSIENWYIKTKRLKK